MKDKKLLLIGLSLGALVIFGVKMQKQDSSHDNQVNSIISIEDGKQAGTNKNKDEKNNNSNTQGRTIGAKQEEGQNSSLDSSQDVSQNVPRDLIKEINQYSLNAKLPEIKEEEKESIIKHSALFASLSMGNLSYDELIQEIKAMGLNHLVSDQNGLKTLKVNKGLAGTRRMELEFYHDETDHNQALNPSVQYYEFRPSKGNFSAIVDAFKKEFPEMSLVKSYNKTQVYSISSERVLTIEYFDRQTLEFRKETSDKAYDDSDLGMVAVRINEGQ